MICGLLRRDGGEVIVAGRPVDIGATDAKAAIGYVPQDLAIYPDLTARENLRFFGRLQRLRGKELDRRVDEVLAVTDLADRASDRTDTFSGGMKRRLNIGIGLLHHPTLLVLDEPTVGVDPQSRNAILSSVAALEQEGMAILYTTHYMEEAERLCDRIGIIDEGRIRAEGTRRELVALVGQKDRVELAAGGTVGPATAALQALDGVEEATAADGHIELVVERGAAPAAAHPRDRGRGRGGRPQRGGRGARPRGGLPAPDRQGAAGLSRERRARHRRQGPPPEAPRPLRAADGGGRAARASPSSSRR